MLEFGCTIRSFDFRIAGPPGKDGSNGAPGAPGANGLNGKDGAPVRIDIPNQLDKLYLITC